MISPSPQLSTSPHSFYRMRACQPYVAGMLLLLLVAAAAAQDAGAHRAGFQNNGLVLPTTDWFGTARAVA